VLLTESCRFSFATSNASSTLSNGRTIAQSQLHSSTTRHIIILKVHKQPYHQPDETVYALRLLDTVKLAITTQYSYVRRTVEFRYCFSCVVFAGVVLTLLRNAPPYLTSRGSNTLLILLLSSSPDVATSAFPFYLYPVILAYDNI
jgi:ribosomal protein S26